MIGRPRGKKGTYPVSIYDPAKGRKVYVGSAPDKKAAKILEAAKLEEFSQPKADPARSHTVDSYADRFLDVLHTPAKRRGEPTTRVHNECMLRPFRALYGARQLASITRTEANDWAAVKPSSAKTVKAMFAEAAREDAIPTDPFARVQFPKQRGRSDIDPLTEDEIEKLGEIAIKAGGLYGPEMWALIMFAAWTGMRPGEVCALNWAEVNLADDTVRVEWSMRNDGTRGPVKGKQRREIVLAPKAREAILSLGRRDGNVFRSPTLKPLRPNSLRGYWVPIRDGFTAQLPESHWLRRRLLADPKDKLDPYEMRHAFGSMLADRGLSAWDISQQMGNTPAVCERVYVHPHKERSQKRVRDALASGQSDSLGEDKSARAVGAAERTAQEG